MKAHKFAYFISMTLLACGLTGCQTDGNAGVGMTGDIKTQGVYTTIALSGPGGLDMSASEYIQKKTFGPGEMPAAVVLGYGFYDQQQSANLELIESDTGRSLWSKDFYASYGKAMVKPLFIRLGGNYELRLSSGGSPLDSWQFTVTRTNSSGVLQVDNKNSTASYAHVGCGLEIGPGSPDFFATYDDTLVYKMVNAVNKEAGALTNASLFAQRFPGNVVMRCHLDARGNLSEPKILENTLDDDCAAVFQKALLGGSPYDAWPQDVRQKFGSDDRYLKITVYVN